MSRKIALLSVKNLQRRSSLCCIRNIYRLYHQPLSSLSLLQPKLHSSLTHRYSDFSSELGIRSSLPPDTNSQPDSNRQHEISDQEWEIRIGRAIYVLQQTLPDFFTTGLITSIDKSTGIPRPSASIHIPVANSNPLDYQTLNDDVESIYSPRVRLLYTPPVTLPPLFPKTMHIEGLPLYLASSVFVRHSLNALYSDLKVVLRKVNVQNPGSPSRSIAGTSLTNETGTNGGESPTEKSGRRKSREKSLFVGLTVTGTARVSGGLGEWEVNSTYTFSPITGLIHTHTVNSIHPAPHQAVYDALRASLGKVFGLGLEGRGAMRSGKAGMAYGLDPEVIVGGEVNESEEEKARKE